MNEQCRLAAILDKADAIRRKRREALKLADDFLRAAYFDIQLSAKQQHITTPCQINDILADKTNAIRSGPFGSELLHSEFLNLGTPVLGIENVVTNRFQWTEPRCITSEKYEGLRRFRVYPGDVIVTIMGTTGRTCVTPYDLPECISTKHLCVMTLNKAKALPEYLWATLVFDPDIRRQTKQAGKGAIMEGWNLSIVRDLHLDMPPIEDQARFVRAMRQAEKISHRLQQVLDESENLFASLSHRAFQGTL